MKNYKTDERNQRIKNGKIYSISYGKHSVLPRCQLFSTWSTDSMQSQSESQQVILWIWTNWS